MMAILLRPLFSRAAESRADVVFSLPVQQPDIALTRLTDSSARGRHNLIEPGGHCEC